MSEEKISTAKAFIKKNIGIVLGYNTYKKKIELDGVFEAQTEISIEKEVLHAVAVKAEAESLDGVIYLKDELGNKTHKITVQKVGRRGNKS